MNQSMPGQAAPIAASRRADIERQVGRPLPELSPAERIDCIGVMTGEERWELLAFVAAFAPDVFDAAVAARSPAFAGALAARLDAQHDAEETNDPG